MNEVEGALPTVVLGARQAGREIVRVRVSCDQRPIADILDGKAIPLDPGIHSFVFQAEDGSASVEADFTIRAGEKNRLLEVSLPSSPAPATQPAPAPRTVPAPPPVTSTVVASEPAVAPAPMAPRGASASRLPYLLGGTAVAGVAGFVTFAILGRRQERDLAGRCAPDCVESEVAAVRLKYALADASLGIGVVAAGISVALLLTRPREGGGVPTEARGLTLTPRISPGTAALDLGGSF